MSFATLSAPRVSSENAGSGFQHRRDVRQLGRDVLSQLVVALDDGVELLFDRIQLPNAMSAPIPTRTDQMPFSSLTMSRVMGHRSLVSVQGPKVK